MDIGTRIMYLRKMNKLTQSELGAKLGVSYMTVRRWETGKSVPKADEIQGLAEVLKTSTEYLMGKEEPLNMPERGTESSVPSMAYWGGILDNAERAAKDGKNLGIILALLNNAANTVKVAMG